MNKYLGIWKAQTKWNNVLLHDGGQKLVDADFQVWLLRFLPDMFADGICQDGQDDSAVMSLDAVESIHECGQIVAANEADLTTVLLTIIEGLGPEVVDIGISNDDPSDTKDKFF